MGKWMSGAVEVMKFLGFFAGSEFAMQIPGCKFGRGVPHRDSFGHETIRTNEKRRPQ